MKPVAVVPRFEISLRSGTEATRLALEQVMNKLAPLQLDTEELGTVEIVLAEVLNNVVEHAYPEDGPKGSIYIECAHLPDGLHFVVFDTGFAMPDGKTPLGICPDPTVDMDDLPEGGFGWFLIRDLAKDVEYKRAVGGNQLSLRIAVAYGRTSKAKPH